MLNGLGIYAQTLTNTKWKVYSNFPLIYFHFGTDTLSYSSDNISYSNVSIFKVNGNNFTINDLPLVGCLSTDTGRYTFVIHNDTLKFTLVSDSCTSRATALTTDHFVRFYTSVRNLNDPPAIQLYPNPAGDEIFIKSDENLEGLTFYCYDGSGRQVLTGKLTGETTSIDIKQLTPGLYFFRIGEFSKQTIVVMKK